MEEVAGAIVVPLGIAIAVEWTTRRVVTDNPVLVWATTGVLGDERSAPGRPIGRGAVQNSYAMGTPDSLRTREEMIQTPCLAS
jgi:hypothetical protein